MTETIIVTRHRPLVDLLIELGLANEDTPVFEHVTVNDVRGKRVLGVMPLHLACEAAHVIEVPLDLTLADREMMTAGDIPISRLREIAGEPVAYVVGRFDDVHVGWQQGRIHWTSRDPMASFLVARDYGIEQRHKDCE